MDGCGSAVRWLAVRWLRRRWLAMVPLALLVATGAAGSVAALTSADRTARAYDEYLERADVGDVTINAGVNTREVDGAIRALPNVAEVTSSVVLTASIDDGRPRSRRQLRAESGGLPGGILGSTDGRFVEMDRPTVQAGRLPTGQREIAVNQAAAEDRGITVGDVLPLALWSDEVSAGELVAGYQDEVVPPIGVEHLTVVGIVTLHDEVLPDDLYERHRAIVSPDVVARYDCLPAAPDAGSTVAEVHAALLPHGCAVRYRIHSVSFTGGRSDVKAALAEVVEATNELNEVLATIVDLGDRDAPRYSLIPTEIDSERRRVARAVRPTVTAMLVLGIAVSGLTVAVGGLAAGREVRRAQPDQRQWHHLGVPRAARAVVVAGPLALAVLLGTALGLGAAVLADPRPLGLVDVLAAPSQDLGRTGWAAIVVGLATALVAAAAAAVSARRTGPWDRARAQPRSSGLPVRAGSPAVADGVRAAVTSRTTAPTTAAGALLIAVLVAVLVFGASLSTLLSTPRSYGWPWDVAAVTGYGYFGLDLGDAEEHFADDPAVQGWAVAALTSGVAVDGEPTMAIVAFDRADDLDLPVLAGRLPTARDEVALGVRTAAARDLGVGDQVTVGGVISPPRPAQVTGIAVLPTLGAFEAERAGSGSGMLVGEDTLADSLLADSLPFLASFIGIDLHDEADTPAIRAEVRERFRDLDASGLPLVDHLDPVRPPEIVDAAATRAVPAAVATAFAATLAAGLAVVSWAATRARRRDLAVLRALGFTGAELRASVHVQSLVTMVGALALGVPAGLVAGRALWGAFARELGVVPIATGAWTSALLAVAGGLALAGVAAAVPAWLAARNRPAAGLRTE